MRLGTKAHQHHNDLGGPEMTVVTDTIPTSVDTPRNLFGALDLIKAQPELAKFQLRATN
jgi:hypothetical protein